MNTTTVNEDINDYAEGVRAFFGSFHTVAGERGSAAEAVPLALAEQAERLAPKSSALTRTLSGQMEDADPAVRLRASTRLLAKALTDLEVSASLLQAAQEEADEQAEGNPPEDAANPRKGVERSAFNLSRIEEHLELIADPTHTPEAEERGESEPTDIPQAQKAVNQAVEDTLTSVVEKAGKVSQSALGGLLALGGVELARQAGAVVTSLAQTLHAGALAGALYAHFRAFVGNAYETIVTLVGHKAAEAVSEQAVEWLKELKEGKAFGDIVSRLYQTARTQEAIKEVVAKSKAELSAFVATGRQVEVLEQTYVQQAALIEKLLRGLKFLGSVVAALPDGTLVLAGGYLLLAGYAVAVGADIVDASTLRLLDRTPGVRRIVTQNLETGAVSA